MNRRFNSGAMNPNPKEELEEVYAEVAAMEEDFKKALGISQHLLGNSRQLITQNQELTNEADQLKHDHKEMQENYSSH